MLKRVNIKRVLAILASVFALCLVGFALTFNSSSAYAQTEAKFCMDNGASIRLADDGYGMRFTTTVTESYYNNLKAQYGENAEIKFYTLINHSGLDVDKVVYTDITNNWLIPCSKTVTFTDGEFVFYSTVMYRDTNEYSEEILDKAFGLDITARAYVTVNGEHVDYADTEDTTYSMKGIANYNLLLDDANDDMYEDEQVEKLRSYLIKESATIHQTNDDSAGFYGDTTVGVDTIQKGALELEDCDVSSLSIGDELYAYVGAKSVKLKKIDANNTVEISGYDVDSSAIGKNGQTLTLTVIGPDGDLYRQNFTAVTRRITTASDLAIFSMGYYLDGSHDYTSNGSYKVTGNYQAKYNGYYVLANDIDASNYEHKTPYVFLNSSLELAWYGDYANSGLTGTFDGNGYTISNLGLGVTNEDNATGKFKLEYGYFGLFGAIGSGATVKDVYFKNASFDSNGYGPKHSTSLLATFINGATIENVKIELNGLNKRGYRYFTAPLAYQVLNSTINNLIIELGDDGTTGTVVDSLYGSLAARKFEDSTLNNVYVVSSTPLTRAGGSSGNYAGNETGAGTQLAGVKRYDNGYELYTAKNTYTAFDNGLWNLVDDCAPVWKGEKAEKYLSYAYSQDDKAFFDGKTLVDFAKFGGDSVTTNLSNYTVSIENGAVTVLKDSNANFVAAGEALDISFEGETFNSVIGTNVYTKVINEASDLAIFSMGYSVDPEKSYDSTTICNGDSTTKYNGYYILGGDIDATGYNHKTPYMFTGNGTSLAWPEWFQQNGVKTCGLTGTFDGNGYTISNLTFGKDETITWNNRFAQEYGNGGLFGAIGYNGTVKNVSFDNVSFALKIGNGVECKVANTFVLAAYIVEANIENVHISLNGLNRIGSTDTTSLGSTATLAHQIMKSKLTNVIIEVADDGLTGKVDSNNYGSLVGRNNGNMLGNLATYGTWTNVIVISTIGLGRNGEMCGENETTGSVVLTGARRYNDVDAFDADTTKDLTGFTESGWWTVNETGLPVFGRA